MTDQMEHNVTADFLIHFLSDNISRCGGEHNVPHANTENVIELCEGNKYCICFHEIRHQRDYFWLLFACFLFIWAGGGGGGGAFSLKLNDWGGLVKYN